MAFIHLGDLLPRNLRAAGIDRQVRAAQVISTFAQVVGQRVNDAISARAQAVVLRDGVLTVRCANSAIAQELRLRERDLLADLNERVGGGVVRLHLIQS